MEPVFPAGATSLKILPSVRIYLVVLVLGLGQIQELVCMGQTAEVLVGLVHMDILVLARGHSEWSHLAVASVQRLMGFA